MYEDHKRMIFISYTALADRHAADEAYRRARYEREQERRYLRGEISYRTWVDGAERRRKTWRKSEAA